MLRLSPMIRRAVCLLVSMLGLVCAPGCISTGGDLPDELDAVLAYEFAPVSLRISPLTRLETGTDGAPELAVYFELADQWGHLAKSPGVVQVQLYRIGGVSQGLATLADQWRADLTNPDRNSAMFDVTGMYRVPLADLPDWLSQRADGSGEAVRVRVRVFMRTIGRGGETIDLRDTFEKDF
ncbi:MAG: hypothetical protein Phyf2KO_25270 [Phycisphaerales bacterium]